MMDDENMSATKAIETEAGEKKAVIPASMTESFSTIWRNRRPILLFSLVAAVITLAINMLLPRYYRATATLLPEAEKNNLSSFTQFADIAQVTGVTSGNGEIARLYPAILESESVLLEVIRRQYHTESFREPVDLITYFEFEEDTPAEDMEKAIETLRDLLESAFDNKTGIVSASIEMKEPQLAADLLNAMISELDRFMRAKRITSASEQLRWINTRLGEVAGELMIGEDSLRVFRDHNRRIGDSPFLMLQQKRLIRQVEISSTTFVELKKQYELAKIEEIKNISLINVLDSARPPIRKSRPRQVTNTALMLVLALASLSGYYVFRERYVPRVKHFLRNIEASDPSR